MPGDSGYDATAAVAAARKAGYTEDEILQHLASTRNVDAQAAIKSGTKPADLILKLAGMPAQPVAPVPDVKMKQSVLPKLVRGTTATLPVAGGMAGIAAGAPTVGGAALGGAVGGAAGTVAKQTIDKSIFGEDEVSPTSKEGLLETGENAALGALSGAAEGTVAKATRAGAAAKAATKAEQLATAQRAATSTASKKLATEVAEKAAEAADNGILVDGNKSVYQVIKKLTPANNTEFMQKVQPILSGIQKRLGIQNIGKVDPHTLVNYRDEVAEALSDPQYSEYRDKIFDAISKDLRTQVPELAKADSSLGIDTPILKTSAKIAPPASVAAPTPTPSASGVRETLQQKYSNLVTKWGTLKPYEQQLIKKGAQAVGAGALLKWMRP